MYVEAPPPTSGLFGVNDGDRLLKVMRAAADLETLRIHAHLLNAERFARTGTPKREGT